MKNNRWAFIWLLMLGLSFGVAVSLASTVSSRSVIVRPDIPDELSEATTTPSPEPWPPKSISVDLRTAANTTMADWVSMSEVIAEVHVDEIETARFNTQSGAMPTQDPTGADHGLYMFSPVVLRVTTYLKGEDLGYEGYIVNMWGGQTDDFVYDASPQNLFTVDTDGLVFLRRLSPNSPVDSVGEWMNHLRATAADLNANGGNYEAAEVLNYHEFYYEFDNVASSGLSSTDGSNIPRDQLLNEVTDAIEAESGP